MKTNNEISLKDKSLSLHRAVHNLLVPDNAISMYKSSLMKSMCQVLGDEEPVYVCNDDERHDFTYSLHSLYEFLSDLERAGIDKEDDVDALFPNEPRGGRKDENE
jgi:hypothetical protein